MVAAPPPGFTLSVALLLPELVGLNATSTKQLLFAASEVVQVCVFTNWFAFVPPSVMLVMGMATLEVFATVMRWLVLVALRSVLGNVSVAGVSV